MKKISAKAVKQLRDETAKGKRKLLVQAYLGERALNNWYGKPPPLMGKRAENCSRQNDSMGDVVWLLVEGGGGGGG